MDPVSLGFASVAMLELCLRCGRNLRKRCQSYRDADRELRLTVLEVSGYWFKIEHQIRVLHDHWDEIDSSTQIHLYEVFHVLEGILRNALYIIDKLVGDPLEVSDEEEGIPKTSNMNRLKYAAYGKKALAETIKNLEKWHRLFDPSWFLLSRSSNATLYHQLANDSERSNGTISTILELIQVHDPSSEQTSSISVFLGADDQVQKMQAIPLAPAHSGWDARGRPVIVDRYPVRDGVHVDLAKKDVRYLARILSKVDPAFSSLLRCAGVVPPRSPSNTDITHFDIIFNLPPALENAQAVSLRRILLKSTASYPLNDRIHLATSLARSVVFLHASRIVHKNISPENIVVLQPDEKTLGTPFLVGFERFRSDDWQTNLTGDNLWEKNLYRHPHRQGSHPEDRYTMRHDMYSVGVCLLEIGLWRSFVHYSDNGEVTGPDPELAFAEILSVKNRRAAAISMKSEFVALAERYLPQLMGRIYTSIVVSCLTCLDPDNSLFKDASEFEDADGILVGVRYIEKILVEIEKIQV